MEKYCITQVNKKNPIYNVILISKNTSEYRKRVWEEMPKASPLVAETWAPRTAFLLPAGLKKLLDLPGPYCGMATV